MGAEQTIAFLVFAVVAAVTPGPSNVMLTATGAIAGIRGGLPCLAGVASGAASMMLAVACGLGGLVLAQPRLLLFLKVCGSAYLLWLAWRIATAPVDSAAPQGRPAGFADAFAFQWINPKPWMVSTGAAGAYLGGDAGVLGQAAWIAALFFAACLPCGFAWLAFGSAMRRLLGSERRRRAFNISMGVLLAASVMLLAA